MRRTLVVVMMLLVALVAPVPGQESGAPWQATVSGQVEAFRAGDGAAALRFAGKGFRRQFAGQPDAFRSAIMAAGYAPIVESRSHSFGTFERLEAGVVLQAVTFVSADQALFEAVYRLIDEPGEGWRVQGVILRRGAGIGI